LPISAWGLASRQQRPSNFLTYGDLDEKTQPV